MNVQVYVCAVFTCACASLRGTFMISFLFISIHVPLEKMVLSNGRYITFLSQDISSVFKCVSCFELSFCSLLTFSTGLWSSSPCTIQGTSSCFIWFYFIYFMSCKYVWAGHKPTSIRRHNKNWRSRVEGIDNAGVVRYFSFLRFIFYLYQGWYLCFSTRRNGLVVWTLLRQLARWHWRKLTLQQEMLFFYRLLCSSSTTAARKARVGGRLRFSFCSGEDVLRSSVNSITLTIAEKLADEGANWRA